MRKFLPYIVILIILAGLFSPMVQIQAQVDTDTTYKLLAPLPGLDATIDTQKSADNPCAFGKYMNSIISLIIGLIAIGAVVMIVMGGLQYMTSELVSSKEAGKDRIRNALLGLLIALGAYVLLFTINEKLVDMCLDLPEVKIVIGEGREIAGTAAVCGKTIIVNGQTLTSCNESEITTINFLGKQVRVNRVIVPDLQAIDAAWRAVPEATRYQVNTIGSYNPRGAIGSPSSPSSHAFGVGLDINENTNPYSDSLTPCTTNMPASFIQLFTSRGFGWGGYWVTKKDTMHFSKQSNEAKYVTGACAGLTR